MRALRRGLPLWAALLAAYVAALVVAGPEATGAERHRLRLAETLVERGELRAEPQALGFQLLIAPAQALGGETAVRVWLAALCALGFSLAAALGRRLVPDPWAGRAALVCGLSPPAIGAATAVAPEGVGAAALAGAALLALRVGEAPRLRTAVGSAVLAAAAPWLAVKLVAPAAVVAVALLQRLRRAPGLARLLALEAVIFSAVLYVTVSHRAFGVLTPEAVADGGLTGAHRVAEHVERWPRLLRALLDIDAGLLVWAPFTALVGVAGWLLWRSRRERLAAVSDVQAEVEAGAALLLALAAAVWLVAAFAAPAIEPGGRAWSHARQLIPALPALAALCAWGLRRVPRVGAALAAATLALSVAMVAAEA